MSVKQSIYIEAPVEKVFDFCKDPRKTWAAMPEGVAGSGELSDVTMTAEGVGTYYSWTMKVAGLRVEGFNVFTEFIPNQRITDRSSRTFVGTWTVTFEPEGTGTRVTEWRHPVSFPPMRPLDRLMDRFRMSLEQQSLAKMKEALEKSGAPETSAPPAAAAPAASASRGAR